MQSKILKLRILTASLKLKFKCKMRVQSNQGAATQEITSNNGIFTIEEELHIYPKNNHIELALMLISEKGSQYNGGTVKTTLDQLRHSQGSPLKLTISKCIDKEAWMEVKAISVPDLDDKSSQKQLSFTQQRVQNGLDSVYTPERIKKPNLVIQSNLGETRSEHCFPQPTTSFNITQERKRQHDTGRPIYGEYSNVRMVKQRQSRQISPFQSSPARETPEQWATQEDINKVRQEVDLSASKLKKMQDKLKQEQQKSRQEMEKRKSVEFSEHSYKLEVIKLGISKEEKEKQLNKKENKIRQLEGQLNKSKENLRKTSQLKDQLNSKNAQIKALRTEVQTCKAEIAKAHHQLESQRHQCQDKILKVQKQSLKQIDEKQEIIQDLTRKLKAKEEQLNMVTSKLIKAEGEIQRDKKFKMNIDYKSSEAKNEYQKIVNYLKKELKLSKDQYASLLSKTEKQRSESQKEISSMREQCEKLRVASSKLTIQKRSMEEQIAGFEQNLQQLKRYREKYADQSSKFKSIKQQLTRIKRKYESTLQSNHKLEERLKNYYQNIEQYNKNQQINELRCSELEDKIKKMEDEIIEGTMLLQKQKRIQQGIIKECSHLKEKEKQLKSQFSRKEVEFTKLKLELENIHEKLQTRQVKNDQQSQKMFNYHHDDWQQSKLNSMIEAQKYLEMEIMNHKHTISQLQIQIARYKEENQRYNKTQFQWRELERNWEAQKLRLTTENSKFVKQVKELNKRIGQEDAKSMVLNEKLQKQKKNSKNWQQKYTATESALKKAHDDRQQASSQLQIKQTRLKMMENEITLLKGELELRENESKKYKNTNEALDIENRRLRQEVGDLSFRLKEEQHTCASQNKKAREQMARYESRLMNYKKQSEKFKDNLRSVLVQSIISQLSKEQQQSQSIAKKKQAKLGLTLTNELIIKLEEYLKELSRHKAETEQRLRTTEKELISTREETILKTNQFQNTEAQLKLKLDELIDNLNKMKQIYETRQQDMRKSLTEAQWQLALKDNQLEKLKETAIQTTKKYESEAANASQASTKTERNLNAQIDRLKLKIKDQSEREVSYAEQIASLQQYIDALEEKIAKFRTKEFELEQKLEKITKDNLQYEFVKDNLTQNLEQSSKQKSELKNNISALESQLQQSKILCGRFKSEVQNLEKEKSEESTLIRNIMKEKQTLLHQYLSSQQKLFELEAKNFEFQEKINQISAQQISGNKIIDQTKEQKKKMSIQLKNAEANLIKKQSELKEAQEKIKEKEKQNSRLTQQNATLQSTLSQMKQKLENSNKNWQIKLAESEHLIELKSADLKSHIARSDVLTQKCDSLELQQRKAKQSIEQLKYSLEETNQRLSESLQTNQKMQVELFSLKSQLTQLQEELDKAKEEIEDKDLKNYMLSSQIYKVETDSAQQISQLEEKIITQEQSMLKYEEICEEYTTQIEILKKTKEELGTMQTQAEAELIKANLKYKSLEEELSTTSQIIKDLTSQIEKLQEAKLKMQSIKSSQDYRMQQQLHELQDKMDRRQNEFQRCKNENELLHQMLKKLQQNCKSCDAEYQELLKRCSNEAQTSKKNQLQVKKMREDLKQLKWSNQRQIKKAIQARIRSINQSSEEQAKLGDHLKGLEESLLDIIKSYDSV